ANERAERINADSAADLLLRKVIRDHRISAGRERGLAHAYAHARSEHMHEALTEPARRRCDAPQRDARRDDARTRETIGEIGNRHAHHRVEERERESMQEAEL